MSIISFENVSKGFVNTNLFEDITFHINEEDKIGLIGVNGTGKSTLLKILSGIESPDLGQVVHANKLRIEHLTQDPIFDIENTILEQILSGDSPTMQTLRSYEVCLEQSITDPDNGQVQNSLMAITEKMNELNVWDLESQVKTILTKLGITNFNSKIETLSGGQKKRVALAASLLAPCDLLILDEPTNHMDNDSIDWLEKYLQQRKGALIMVTHDRYFLDRVVNKTIELDHGRLFTYTGNYTGFVEKKAERISLESSMESKRQNLYKTELAWIRAGVQGRGTKQKARIQRFTELKHTKYGSSDDSVEISVGHTRLGKKIIEIENLSKSFGDNALFKDFSYTVLKDDRIGIIGDNGCGKSTLLNIIAGNLQQSSGLIDIGKTVKIGYFSQDSGDMNPEMKAIDYIKEHGEYVTTESGAKITAAQMMEKFLFDKEMQWTYIHRLSGGEKRRLYLLRILMECPNILILDEPTNDLDIDTLKVLESYIDDFSGVVITVSHDRYFLDRIATKIFSFESGLRIVNHVGNYSDFVEYRNMMLKEQLSQAKTSPETKKVKSDTKVKFTYKEKLEFESIELEIEALESKLSDAEKAITDNASSYSKLPALVEEKDMIEMALLEKMERFEELSEKNQQIINQRM